MRDNRDLALVCLLSAICTRTSKSWDGNTSDSQIFQDRAQALVASFKRSPTPRYLVADSKLYHEDNASNLQAVGFITRIPQTLQLVAQVIEQALRWDT